MEEEGGNGTEEEGKEEVMAETVGINYEYKEN